MIRQMEQFLKDVIEPGLKAHGGGVELVDIDNNIVFIKMHGGCVGCAMSQQTLILGIKSNIQKKFPEIKDVIDLTNHADGKNPYYKK